MGLIRFAVATDRLGPAMAGVPVAIVSPGWIDAGGVRRPADRGDLTPARLWIARGVEWQGPFPGWRRAREAIEALGGPVEALAHGRASILGAVAYSRGWRWRLAWGGVDPPGRYRE